jgi:hypothetical protein
MAKHTVPQPKGIPAVPGMVKITGQIIPDRLYVLAPGLDKHKTRPMAYKAAEVARTLSPRLSGRAAEGIKAYWGDGFFGVRWDRPYLWYQEGGIGPFTMRNLAGKTIPMWVDDWTGQLHRANPKAETRITANGRRQIKIFRKAGKIGARKRAAVRDPQGRLVRWRSVPQSYPGAPGRITHREWKPPSGTTGRIVRLISRPHVGVRWRHPGLVPREFMQHAIQQVALANGLSDTDVFATYGRH